MVLSVSDAVVEILENMHFLKPAMKLDLVNYSALARVIRPAVEKRMGEKVELETIIMAIRRNAHVLVKQTGASVLEVLKKSKVDLVTGMAFVKLRHSQTVSDQLMDFVKHVNSEQMENIYILHRIDEIAAVMPEQLVDKLDRIPAIKKDSGVVKEVKGELAVITIRLPESSIETPGVLALVLNGLADMGISLFTVVGSFSRVGIVLSENDAPVAYERINTIIRRSRDLSEITA